MFSIAYSRNTRVCSVIRTVVGSVCLLSLLKDNIVSDSDSVMLASEMGAFYVLFILIIFSNSGFLCIAGGLLNFTSSTSLSHKNVSGSRNTELESKRGVPSGANPLHNR